MAANRVVVLINGVRYPIRTVEEPGYVSALAEEMDNALHNLISKGALSLNEALVLISLEYLDSYKKSDRNLDNMRSQLAEYMEDAASARQELNDAKKEIERLKRKLEENGKRKTTA
ncbi:MAG: cell division protein ZapA [Oscillospiraceae bacterium]|jgi:cell division protein ZapA|nr:cell division protein ZapA [Oscillospiraceae bacterium]